MFPLLYSSSNLDQQQKQKQKERVFTVNTDTLLPTRHTSSEEQQQQQQQMQVQPDNGQQLLWQLVSRKRAVAVVYAVLLLLLVYHLGRHLAISSSSASSSSSSASSSADIEAAADGSSMLSWLGTRNPAGRSTALNSSYASKGTYGGENALQLMYSKATTGSGSSSSSRSSLSGLCAYGSLPGTWVSSAPAGARWQILDPDCQLKNWLAVFEAATRDSSAAGSGTGSSNSSHNRSISSRSTSVKGQWTSVSSSSSSGGSSSSSGHPPPAVRVLLLSDSVDRYLVQHVCEVLDGVKETHVMKPTPEMEAADRAAVQQAAAAAASGPQKPPGYAVAGPTPLNATAYAFHTCFSSTAVKLASSYFPGVHPTGPFHRFTALNYQQRIDSARKQWTAYAGPGSEPHLVSVASLLWDLARMYAHERHLVDGRQELQRAVLDGWVRNFTAVVRYAQKVFPETRLWMTHTTMVPYHDTKTGLMSKPYLGRAYFIHQLNAAATTAALKLGLQLVDYEAVSERFAIGQEHLVDLIHPNAMVGVEVFNVMLNLVLQQQQRLQQAEGAG